MSSWANDCRTECCRRQTEIPCTDIGLWQEPAACFAKIQYNWDCRDINLECSYTMSSATPPVTVSCADKFNDQGNFMMYGPSVENWAMNNNQMKLFDHFYYKYNYPQDPSKNCDSSSFRCEWYFCNGEPWDGVTNDTCWIEKCKNDCGDEICKKWNIQGEWWAKEECPLSGQAAIEKELRDASM